MSLFPAYVLLQGEENKDQSSVSSCTVSAELSASTAWLENSSFAGQQIGLTQTSQVLYSSDTTDTSSSDSSSNEDVTTPTPTVSSKTKKHKKKKRNEKDCELEESLVPTAPVLEFHDEDFYVDKKPSRMYKTIRTLHKPACPRYRRAYSRRLGHTSAGDLLMAEALERRRNRREHKRYFRHKLDGSKVIVVPKLPPLEENEYTLQLGQLNRRIMETPNELDAWLELVRLQERNPYRWSRLLLAEKQLDYVQRALVYHPKSEVLYRHYIDIINATYPAFEVSKLLDKLLGKDAYSYTLWTAQIMTTQGSMARCVVPDVLRIYERCMQKMHHHSNKAAASGADGADTDDVMLQLFNNCALFLRQAGLYEQFFALLKLALELNVSTEQFGDFAPAAADQCTLIEYEELILQSGLPMNEIWLRVERLRQGFNFLPCPAGAECADPQRIVFNEDVCHYIYPLKRRDNAFYLMLLVLRLLKLPFVQCDGLAGRLCARVEDIGDSDAIEDVLAVCVRGTYALPAPSNDAFLASLYELAKEMTVSPTYMSNAIGHEIYTRCLSDILLNCAATQAGIDERKRVIFILLWCRFERMLLVLQRCAGKLDADYVKAGRKRFKALLKQSANRNVLYFYTEFALFEYEALDPAAAIDGVCRIFDNIIAAHAIPTADSDEGGDDREHSAADVSHLHVMYAELLIGRGMHEEAVQVIIGYALGNGAGSVGAAKKLSALQRLNEKLDRLVAIERHVEIMVLEQYLLPDYAVTLLRLRTLLQCLIGQKLEALAALDKLLQTFRRADSDRHAYLRERIYELYVLALQLPCASSVVSPVLLGGKLSEALAEYPRNLFLLQRYAMLSSAPWYKIRAALLRNSPSISAVTFLIATARYRFTQTIAEARQAATTTRTQDDFPPTLECDQRHSEAIVRNRLLHLFNMLTSAAAHNASRAHKALLRNALFWRFYLRCLSDQTTAFERSKQCLLTALDECPWAKALYLDGGTYVPQELAHLQDLIIEKQLRIYALPEELVILRER